MDIIYLDKQIVVIIKPAGVLSEGEDKTALPQMLADALLQRGERSTDIFPVHRLDRDTRGVMVYARTSAAAANISRQICQGDFKKSYYAVVNGIPEKSADRLCDLLYYDRRRGKSFVVDRERAGVKRAELEYDVLDTYGELALLKIQLYTGRTHQIRVQLASRSHPLYGDRRYGAKKENDASLALLAHRLCFKHPSTGEPLCFECPLPNELPWTYFYTIL